MKTPNIGKKLVLFAVTLVLGFFSMKLLFGTEAGLIIMAAIFLHELGHFLAFRALGYTAGMLFVPFLGAAVYPDDKERIKNAPRAHEVFIAAAGPFMNVALMIFGLLVAALSPYDSFGLSFASINAALAAFNLLPFGIFDGGRMARAIFASADEAHDAIIARKLTIFAMVGAVVTIVANGGIMFMPILFVVGAHSASKKDDPNEWNHPRSMSNDHSLLWGCIWGGMILLSLAGTGILHYWRDY
jgi:Zn-dependent protease